MGVYEKEEEEKKKSGKWKCVCCIVRGICDIAADPGIPTDM